MNVPYNKMLKSFAYAHRVAPQQAVTPPLARRYATLTLANRVEPTMAMNRSFTKAWRRPAGWLLLLFAGLSLSGCSVAHMALPEGSRSASSELPVEGLRLLIVRNSFDFAPYQVTDVHRGWTKGKGWSISSGSSEFSSSKAKQKYGGRSDAIQIL